MNKEARDKVEEGEALTQENAWLRAYLETLVYHTETFNAVRELRIQVWLLTRAMGWLNDDLQELLRRTKGGFWVERIEALEWYSRNLEGRINKEVTDPKRKAKDFKGSET